VAAIVEVHFLARYGGRGFLCALLPAVAAGYLIARARSRGLRGIRRGVQIGFLALFVMLFFAATYPLYSYIRPDLFLQLDPLAVGSALIAHSGIELSRAWPALVVVAATVLFGRLFCGWVCPLGTVIDISDHLFFRRVPPRKRVVWPRLKYYLLAAGLIAALFSVQLVHLIDPIPVLTRTMATVAHPVGLRAYNVAAALGAGRYAEPRPFHENLVFLTIFVAVLLLGAYGRRFFCRNLCGLGALLAVLGRYGVLKRRCTDACTECLRCVVECKMSAIPPNPHGTVLRECILCWDCDDVCPVGASPVGWVPRAQSPGDEVRLGLTRRRLVGAMASGFAYAVAAKTGAASAHRTGKFIPPPGALHVMSQAGLTERAYAVEDFLATCVRCGECMKACITTALQPALGEGGFEAFWAPIIVPRIGFCEPQCNVCGTVCPTGALRFFWVAEKKHLICGIATINQSTCIAWYDDRDCLACNEACGYQAVEMKEIPLERGDGRRVLHRRPVMVEDKCTGCGECEKACPVKPDAAIYVVALERVQ
jgi:ferredoxin